MAQDSAFWDRNVGGDADSADVWQSPYNSSEYSDIFSMRMASDTASGFVIPGYGNNLNVAANSPAAMNVVVNTGALFIRGRMYENTATNTLTIDAADATNPRIDRVVARITFASQTIRLAVVKGTAAATPSVPALTQTAVTYEIEIAQVYVRNATTSILTTDIADKRLFVVNSYSEDITGLTNLLINSEFMVTSYNPDATLSTYGPDFWALFNTPTITVDTKPTQMQRGQAVVVTASGSDEGISQTIRCKKSTTYAIKVLLFVTTGDVGKIEITTNAASPVGLSRHVRITNAWREEILYYTTESDATTLTLKLSALNTTDIVKLGQCFICEGYYTGTYRTIAEIIPFWNPTNNSETTDYATGTPNLVRGKFMVYNTQVGTLSASNAGLVQLTSATILSNFVYNTPVGYGNTLANWVREAATFTTGGNLTSTMYVSGIMT